MTNVPATGPGSFFGGDAWARRGENDARIAANAIPVGVINAYYGATAPSGWLLCDGSTFSATTYPALSALLGGTTLPNLKGKVVVGMDAAQVEFDVLGETGGEKTHVLSVAEMPGHTHDLNGRPDDPTVTGSFFTDVEQTTQAIQQTTTTATGGGAAHNNLQPYMALSYIIKAS